MSMVNILKNPGFESGITNWSTHCTYPGNRIEPMSTGGKNGACIKLTVPPEKGQSFVAQTVELEPGTYTAKFFAKRTSGNVDVWIAVCIDYEWQFSESFIPKLSTSYTELSFTFTVSGSGKRDVHIQFIAGSAEGVAWFDETSLLVDEEDIEDNALDLGVRYFADVVVNSAGLSVRSQPSTNGSLVGLWPNGRLAVVEAIAGNNEWVTCRWINEVAYVSKAYLQNFRAISNIWDVANILNQVGTAEKLVGNRNLNYYIYLNLSSSVDWCHYFADWIAGHCLWEHAFIPEDSNCREGVIKFLDEDLFGFVNAFHKNDVFTNTNNTKNHMTSGTLDSLEQRYYPSAGDYVYFRKCPGDSGYSAAETSYHVGVVVSSTSVEGGIRVTAIEGNTSGSGTVNGVGFKTYDPTPGTGAGEGGRYHKNILGFGFANGVG